MRGKFLADTKDPALDHPSSLACMKADNTLLVTLCCFHIGFLSPHFVFPQTRLQFSLSSGWFLNLPPLLAAIRSALRLGLYLLIPVKGVGLVSVLVRLPVRSVFLLVPFIFQEFLFNKAAFILSSHYVEWFFGVCCSECNAYYGES